MKTLTPFLVFWQGLNDALFLAGKPELLYGEARDLWRLATRR